MEEQKIHSLIARCEAFFCENCYTENRITRYKEMWRNGILKFMTERKLTMYSPSIGEEYAQRCHHSGEVRPADRDLIRSVHVLDDMLKLGKIRKRCMTPVFYRLDGPIGQEMEKLIVHLTNLRRSQTTIGDYRRSLNEFLTHLTANKVHSVRAIAEGHILSFVTAHPTNKVSIVSSLRVLFRYWREQGLVDGHFGEFFDTYKMKKRERIPSFYTAEEVARIETSIDRSSPVGKRNYAMVLLASRLGLRASDITALSFANIKWDDSKIVLTMQKTGKVIELPLLTEVGNAVIDYLKHGRPATTSSKVFISSRAPYVDATRQMVCGAINRIIIEAGVDIRKKHHGPHSLRHALASAMLYAGSTIPIISEVLGHRSSETTLCYLKIDIESLMKCALPVPEVPASFYEQRGGAFHG